MNEITLLFFATLRDRAGVKETNFSVPVGTHVAELKQLIVGHFPALAQDMDSVLVSVNKEYAFDGDEIPEGAEVALFPPVSGGAQEEFPTVFLITNEEIDLNAILGSVTLPTTGAACFFTGMVRAVTQRNEGHETDYLEYEAYRPMAEGKMRQVAQEIRTNWKSVEGIAIVQRLGTLLPGTPTVMIACTAAHRDTGVFEAARYGIDRLKEIVPIWKKEVGPAGQVWVEGDYYPDRGD